MEVLGERYSPQYSGTLIKRSAKRLGKFVQYIEHLDSTNCTTVIAVMLSVFFCLFVCFCFVFVFCFFVLL